MPKKRNTKIPLKELWMIQKQVTGTTDKLLSMLELANVIAAIKGWPEIRSGQAHYRKFSKMYIQKYVDEVDRAANHMITDYSCYVYFIQQGVNGSVKIGVADNIESRLKSLQTASPVKLNLIASIGCKGRLQAYDLEGQMHKKFAAYRLKGEWFSKSIIYKFHTVKERMVCTNPTLLDNLIFKRVEHYQNIENHT